VVVVATARSGTVALLATHPPGSLRLLALVATPRSLVSTHRDDHATRLRKFALTVHITSSVGWLGAAMVFLLLINAIATILVLEYAQTLSDIAGVAADPTLADDDFVVLLGALQRASGGLLLLLLATVLVVYMPRGMTRYGQRKQHGQRRKQHERTAPVPETGDSPTHFAANP